MYWLVAFGAVVGFLFIIVGLFLLRMKLELRKLTPVATGRVAETVYAIRDGSVNFYLVQDRDHYIAIDAGQNATIVAQELAKMNIDRNRVTAVLLTHTDRDHVGALSLFTNARVYIAEAEEVLLDGRVHRFFVFNNRMPRPYEKLEDGATITFSDLRVRSMLTPGHTPGSMCYLVNEEFLFTGDTLSIRDGRIAAFSRLFNMDTPRQEESFARIGNLQGVRYIFTAHHGFTGDYARAFGGQEPLIPG